MQIYEIAVGNIEFLPDKRVIHVIGYVRVSPIVDINAEYDGGRLVM
jgi:hypothetical protein